MPVFWGDGSREKMATWVTLPRMVVLGQYVPWDLHWEGTAVLWWRGVTFTHGHKNRAACTVQGQSCWGDKMESGT